MNILDNWYLNKNSSFCELTHRCAGPWRVFEYKGHWLCAHCGDIAPRAVADVAILFGANPFTYQSSRWLTELGLATKLRCTELNILR